MKINKKKFTNPSQSIFLYPRDKLKFQRDEPVFISQFMIYILVFKLQNFKQKHNEGKTFFFFVLFLIQTMRRLMAICLTWKLPEEEQKTMCALVFCWSNFSFSLNNKSHPTIIYHSPMSWWKRKFLKRKIYSIYFVIISRL